MFMEAAQGDRRVERDAGPEADPVQRPDRDPVRSATSQFFVTNVQVLSVNGQIVFIPSNSPFPGPGNFADPTPVALTIADPGASSRPTAGSSG